MKFLSIGRLQPYCHGLQLQIQCTSHHLLDHSSQVVQMLIEHINELLVLLIGGNLQIMPKLLNLQGMMPCQFEASFLKAMPVLRGVHKYSS